MCEGQEREPREGSRTHNKLPIIGGSSNQTSLNQKNSVMKETQSIEWKDLGINSVVQPQIS